MAKKKKIKLPGRPVTLSGLDPVARGADRAVYFHPDYKNILFKVLLSREDLALSGFRGLSLKLFPSTRARAILKEYACFVRLQTRGWTKSGDIPVSRLYGFAQTDIGTASIVERVHCDDGPIGPTLSDLKRKGAFSSEHLVLLNDFAARILSWQVRTTDMNMNNIAYGEREGRPQFVLVDGIGDTFAIPIRTWSLFAMKKGQAESFTKIARELGLNWNESRWRFE